MIPRSLNDSTSTNYSYENREEFKDPIIDNQDNQLNTLFPFSDSLFAFDSNKYI